MSNMPESSATLMAVEDEDAARSELMKNLKNRIKDKLNR